MTPNSLLLFRNPSPLLILSSLLVLIPATTPKLNNCKPISCGHLPNIAYPFWLTGKHPSYCGYPAFEVSCQNNTLVLSMSDNFQILSIFYENQSVVLYDTKLNTSKCSIPYSSLSFGLSMFKISSVNRELSFFFCNSYHLPPDYVRVPCELLNVSVHLSNDNWADTKPKSSLSSCRAVRRPVLQYEGANSSDYSVLLRRGFLLNWNVTDCTECKQSNGECGYNEESQSFMCICEDRNHLRHCSEFLPFLWLLLSVISIFYFSFLCSIIQFIFIKLKKFASK
ncbi:putative wall-associated receptor kinase, galacturonan-binding domain-containing protein [Dioscorea sansibarensis]